MSDDKRTTSAKNAEKVSAYLKSHPEFFVNNPELLETLEVAAPKGQLANLTTHQLRVLQQKNKTLKAQMKQLIQNAQHNEALMDRLLNMLIELSSLDRAHFLHGFIQYINNHFPSEYFQIMVAEDMLTRDADAPFVFLTTEAKKQFSMFQMSNEPLSGRLKKEKLQALFKDYELIKSAIVLPIGNQGQFGLMAFASQDEEKYHPNSSSDILQKLTQVLTHYFEQIKNTKETQTMA